MRRQLKRRKKKLRTSSISRKKGSHLLPNQALSLALTLKLLKALKRRPARSLEGKINHRRRVLQAGLLLLSQQHQLIHLSRLPLLLARQLQALPSQKEYLLISSRRKKKHHQLLLVLQLHLNRLRLARRKNTVRLKQ